MHDPVMTLLYLVFPMLFDCDALKLQCSASAFVYRFSSQAVLCPDRSSRSSTPPAFASVDAMGVPRRESTSSPSVQGFTSAPVRNQLVNATHERVPPPPPPIPSRLPLQRSESEPVAVLHATAPTALRALPVSARSQPIATSTDSSKPAVDVGEDVTCPVRQH